MEAVTRAAGDAAAERAATASVALDAGAAEPVVTAVMELDAAAVGWAATATLALDLAERVPAVGQGQAEQRARLPVRAA